MTKHEFPPFNMTIENGKLVPATPYDAERLDSFRRGTKVKVRFTEEKDRVLVRKWWAILGLVVKQCKTPWHTKEEASEAVKLALGIVNLTKTVKNDYLQYPKSLTELEDPELQEAVENMTELLSRMTGVDVETLKKETAHIVPEPDEPHDPETGELSPNNSPSDDGAPQEPSSDDDGAPHSETSPPSDVPSEPEDVSPSSSSGSHLSPETWLLNISRMLFAVAVPCGDFEVLKNQKRAALIEFPKPEDCPERIAGKANSVFNQCGQIIDGALDPKDGLALIAGIVGVDQDDILRKAGS